MTLRGTDPESYITEHTSVYEDKRVCGVECVGTASAHASTPKHLEVANYFTGGCDKRVVTTPEDAINYAASQLQQ